MTLDDLNKAVRAKNYTAGWNKTVPSLWAEPKTPYKPKQWRYIVARESLERAGDLISTELAERRNLLMFDDADPNHYATTRTLVAAYQMLKPGEHARAHRHSPSALRLVLESGDAIATVVDGVELPMSEGAVLLTPGGTWHSHFNNGSKNSYWIDFLDVPLVHQLEPMFFDHHPDQFQVSEQRPAQHPYLIDRPTIEAKLCDAKADPQGVSIVDISNEDLPTIELTVLRFGDNARSFEIQEASNSIFAVMSGEGEMESDGQTIQWSFGDIVSLPMWSRATIKAKAGATLLRVSDKPVMEKLKLFRRGKTRAGE
jgi:gentisate 1,2-dioxygenase